MNIIAAISHLSKTPINNSDDVKRSVSSIEKIVRFAFSGKTYEFNYADKDGDVYDILYVVDWDRDGDFNINIESVTDEDGNEVDADEFVKIHDENNSGFLDDLYEYHQEIADEEMASADLDAAELQRSASLNSSPEFLSSTLKNLSASIDRSRNPSRAKVIGHLKSILRSIGLFIDESF